MQTTAAPRQKQKCHFFTVCVFQQFCHRPWWHSIWLRLTVAVRVCVCAASAEWHPDFRNLNLELCSFFFLVAIICFSLLWLDFWLCYNMHVVNCGGIAREAHVPHVHVVKLCEFRWWDEFVVRSIFRATEIDWRSKVYFGFSLPIVRPESGSMHIKLMNSQEQEIVS